MELYGAVLGATTEDAATETDTTSLPLFIAQLPDVIRSALGVTRPTEQHCGAPGVVLNENGNSIRYSTPSSSNKKTLYEEQGTSGVSGADARKTGRLIRLVESEPYTKSVAAKVQQVDQPGERLKTEPEALALVQNIHTAAAEADRFEEVASAMVTSQGKWVACLICTIVIFEIL